MFLTFFCTPTCTAARAFDWHEVDQCFDANWLSGGASKREFNEAGSKVEADVAMSPPLSLFHREENRDGNTYVPYALHSYQSMAKCNIVFKEAAPSVNTACTSDLRWPPSIITTGGQSVVG